MKEIIEYALAGLIVVMLFPIFDVLVVPYLKLEQKSASAEAAGLIIIHASQVIEDLYAKGNLTQASISDVNLIGAVQERIPLIDLSRYGVSIKVVSLIPEVNVNQSGIEVKSFINGTLYLLVLYMNGSAINLTLNPSESRMMSGYYVYTVSSARVGIGNIKSVVAVVDSLAARGGGYWMNETIDGFPVGVVEGNVKNLRLILSKDINGLLANTTIYYFTRGFSNYSYTRYDFNEIFILYSNSYLTNLTEYHIRYVAEPVAGNKSYLRVMLNTTRMRYSTTYGGSDCSDSTNYTGCTLQSRSFLGSDVSTTPIDWGLYNALLIVVHDQGGVRAIPLYPPRIINATNSALPPPQTATRIASYVRLGLFDYYIEVLVWER